MEVIRIDGYTESEKVSIAQHHLVGRQLTRAALREDEVQITDEALRTIVADYTREAGVRNLERELGKLLRKVATKLASGEREAPVVVDADDVRGWLGRPHFFFEAADRTSVPGVVTGLAVTGAGGDVLFVEASVSDGPEGLTLTGQLGDVMKESAEIALSYVRSHAAELGIDPAAFTGKRFHVHVPAGAVPKDGPSAGVTMTTALVSLLRDVPVRSVVGMTGEVTLQGRVLPIGGVKQKVLAAHRAGLTEVVLPERNGPDLEDVPEEVRDVMTFHLAATIADVLAPALSGAGTVDPAVGDGSRVGHCGLRPGRLTRRPSIGADMDDKQIVERISELAAEEQRLEEAHVGEGLSDDELARKRDARGHVGPALGHAAPAPRQAQRGPGSRRGPAPLRRTPWRATSSRAFRPASAGGAPRLTGRHARLSAASQAGRPRRLPIVTSQPVERVAPHGDLRVADDEAAVDPERWRTPK